MGRAPHPGDVPAGPAGPVAAAGRPSGRRARGNGWLRSGLFWRTFFLLAFLLAASMAAWVASYRIIERTPRASQAAAQIVSLVTITRAALAHSAPDLRRELLFDLASNEGIRIYPLEDNDRIEPPPETSLLPLVRQMVRRTKVWVLPRRPSGYLRTKKRKPP